MKRMIAMLLVVMLVLATACGKKETAKEQAVGFFDSAQSDTETSEEVSEEQPEESEESVEESVEESEETGMEEMMGGTISIGTAEELAAFRDLVNGGATTTNAVLTADIDMSSVCSESIGSWEGISGYEGTFDGQGHVITKLYAVHEEGESMGLFVRCEESSVIRNLGVEDSYIESWNSAGAVVAVSDGTVENCWSNAHVIGGTAGGVGGDVENVINCYNLGTVEAGGEGHVGGVVGWGTNVIGCYNEGTVTWDGEETECWIGGVVGFSLMGTIEDCSNRGELIGGYVGGICGEADETVINRCVNTANTQVNVLGGGIVAQATSSKVTNCGNTGSLTGQFNAGGIVGTGRSVIIKNGYNWGDITMNDGFGEIQAAGIIVSGDGVGIYACYSIGALSAKKTGGVYVSAGSVEEERIYYLEGTAEKYNIFSQDPSECQLLQSELDDGTFTGSMNDYVEAEGDELSAWKDGEKGPIFDWQ